jgi:hypothetical protein
VAAKTATSAALNAKVHTDFKASVIGVHWDHIRLWPFSSAILKPCEPQEQWSLRGTENEAGSNEQAMRQRQRFLHTVNSMCNVLFFPVPIRM